MPFTLLADGDVFSVDAVVDGSRALIAADDLARATGWVLKPEGLCREALCVPLRDPSVATADGQRVDLAGFAAALQRPVAIDVEELSAFLGVAASSRAEQLRGMQAPDFALPDLAGRVHSLGEHRGKKVLLLAYASW